MSNKAFNFIDLTVIITILSITLTSSLAISKKLSAPDKIKATEKKLETIKYSLINYFKAHGSLPCPISLEHNITESLPKKEECFYNNKNYIYGALDPNVLKLDASYMFDSWDHKISYIISNNINEIYYESADFPAHKHLLCWIDASDSHNIQLDIDSHISHIGDKSGNNCHLSQWEKSLQPKYHSNFIEPYAGVLFDGVDDYLKLPYFVAELDQKYTIFLIIGKPKKQSLYNAGRFLNIDYSYYINGNNLAVYDPTKQHNKFFIANLNLNMDYIIFSQKQGRIKNIRGNFITHDMLDLDRNMLNSNSAAYIGNNKSHDHNFSFILYEFLLFDEILSAADIAKIEHYLRLKWDKNYDNSLKIYHKNKILHHNPAFILISHGMNGYGAYNSFGTQKDLSAARGLDRKNLNLRNRDNKFYSEISADISAKTWQKDFDDILRYGSLMELP